MGDQIWAKEAKIGPETSYFCHFLKSGSLVFLEIAYNDSLQQFLTFSGGKTDKKNFGIKFGPKQAKIWHETRFFVIFSSLVR